MNKKVIIAAVVLLGATAFFLLRDTKTVNIETSHSQHESHEHDSDDISTVDIEKSDSHSHSPVQLNKAVDGKIEKAKFTAESPEEENMHKINLKLKEVFNQRENPQELITFFEEEKLAPEMSVDTNESTGTMKMIRTRKSMPGARYFHAQYMGDDPEHTFLQHFSYEYIPGPNSLQKVIQSAEGTFPLANKKIHRDGDFITYDIGDDGQYELSIEKATWESLKDDPYNAHTKEDIGTIITRIELKIHDDGDDHSTHIEP